MLQTTVYITLSEGERHLVIEGPLDLLNRFFSIGKDAHNNKCLLPEDAAIDHSPLTVQS